MENKIALYMRVSVEEGRTSESESISNQRLLLRHQIALDRVLSTFPTEEYVDDGYSGTSLNRPSLQRLFEDVKQGKVSCIMVKDISRFMRDYLSLGDYLENIFPFLGVRFISVNDGYDSSKESNRGMDLDLQFKGLLSEYYARETAEKVTNSLLALKRQGQGKGMQGNPPYGYMRDPNEKNKIIIDEKTGESVKKIFRMVREGYSTTQIARRLNKEAILTPSARKRELTGQTYEELSIYTQNHTKTIWMNATVHRILKNEMYTGTYVFHTVRKTKLYGGIMTKIPREEWERIYNHHPPLVSYEDFNEVQEILSARARKPIGDSKSKEKSVLQGFLFCKECGHSIFVTKYKRLMCNTCRMKNVKSSFDKVSVIEDAILHFLRETTKEQAAHQEKYLKETHSLIFEVEKLEKKKLRIFEEYKAEKISKEDFIKRKKELSDTIQKLNERLNERKLLEEEEVSGLTKEVVEKYILKIVIHQNGGFEVQYK